MPHSKILHVIKNDLKFIETFGILALDPRRLNCYTRGLRITSNLANGTSLQIIFKPLEN